MVNLRWLTDSVDRHFDFWTHDFVPLVDFEDEPATAGETPGADERVYELGVWSEVGIDGIFLLFGRALTELADHALNFLDWVVHCDRLFSCAVLMFC